MESVRNAVQGTSHDKLIQIHIPISQGDFEGRFEVSFIDEAKDFNFLINPMRLSMVGEWLAELGVFKMTRLRFCYSTCFFNFLPLLVHLWWMWIVTLRNKYISKSQTHLTLMHVHPDIIEELITEVLIKALLMSFIFLRTWLFNRNFVSGTCLCKISHPEACWENVPSQQCNHITILDILTLTKCKTDHFIII